MAHYAPDTLIHLPASIRYPRVHLNRWFRIGGMSWQVTDIYYRESTVDRPVHERVEITSRNGIPSQRNAATIDRYLDYYTLDHSPLTWPTPS